MIKSTALYTTAADVASACLDSDNSAQKLTADTAENATSIAVNIVPQNWTINTSLLIDTGYLNEVVVITEISGNTITISELSNAHKSGCSVFNVTALESYIDPASRFFDEETRYNAGWAYEDITETLKARVNKYGNLVVVLGKPTTEIADVGSVTITDMRGRNTTVLDISNAFIVDSIFLNVPAYLSDKEYMATVDYCGGFAQLPGFVSWATSVIAARMYRERQTGYSDTVGSPEVGYVSYKKALPPDVYDIIVKNRRVIA